MPPLSTDPSNDLDEGARLPDLALLFLKLGTTAFGGPAVHLAMMEDEVVRRRGWLSHEEFLDLLGVCNLLPGPNSTEMAIHIGRVRAGWPGLLVAGFCFIAPAMLIVAALAWGYVTYGKLPAMAALLYGIKPVVIAVVLQALWVLGRTAIKDKVLAFLALLALAGTALGANNLAVLLGAGLASLLLYRVTHPHTGRPLPAMIWLLGGTPAAGGAGAAALPAMPGVAFSLGQLFLVFAKIGAVLFGSGYVLLAFLRDDLVTRYKWLSETQLLDAVAVGQVTPGPLFTTATFIGYLLAGLPGALVATAGIFLPAFLFVAVSGPLVPRIRKSAAAGAFLDGINVASLALIAVVTAQLARSALVDWWTVALALASAVLLLRYRVNSVWLVVGGAVSGWLAKAVLAS